MFVIERVRTCCMAQPESAARVALRNIQIRTGVPAFPFRTLGIHPYAQRNRTQFHVFIELQLGFKTFFIASKTGVLAFKIPEQGIA